MDIGMLWFDNDAKTDLNTKVSRAAAYYRTKYGKSPTICFVHPSMLRKEKDHAAGVEVRTSDLVLPNHIWIGVNGIIEQAA
jgi:hypothetical protein